MDRKFNKKIVLDDGSEFYGYGFGADCEKVCELVFNTSAVGYQEIVSDPSYTYQAVVMTYPVIGNYGMTDEDYETRVLTIGALIVRDYNDNPSNFRFTSTLSEKLAEFDIPGVGGVDTRMLTRSIRNEGTRLCIITDAQTPTSTAVEKLKNSSIPTNAVSKVSCKKKWYSRTQHPKYNVVAVDCGIKYNIIRSLNRKGCNVTIVPYNITADEIDALKPDGVFFSNGPGDPRDVPETIDLIRNLKGKYPIFGICLGHQLICLAYGGETYKLKYGHRGGNHPVKRLADGKLEITSQNHSYAVSSESLEGTPLKVTHINLLDNTVEGLECSKDKLFSVQYHPESAPGPQDSGYLFDKFIEIMEEAKCQREAI